MTKAQDPFAPTADPGLYVQREATEHALEALRRIAFEESGNALLRGPTGAGKSLLLRVLARQADTSVTCVHVPVPSLDPEGLTTWIASRLPRDGDVGGSEALLHTAREQGILLLIEDAEHLPEESARALAELHRASDRAIRCVFTSSADEPPSALADAFDSGLAEVHLAAPMSRAETADYIAQRLATAGVPPSVAERFDARVVDQIYANAEGIPSRVNQAARDHMPAAAKPLVTASPPQAEPAPQGALWQDPFPEPRSQPAPRPQRRRPRRHAPRPAKTRSRRGWGLAVLAGAATFAVGLLLGPWLRGPSEPPQVAVQPPAQELAPVAPPQRPVPLLPPARDDSAADKAVSSSENPPAEAAGSAKARPASEVAGTARAEATSTEPSGAGEVAPAEAPTAAAASTVAAEDSREPAGQQVSARASPEASVATPAAPAQTPLPAQASPPLAARPAPKPVARPASPAPRPAATGSQATAIIGPRAVAGAKPPFERVPETPSEMTAFLVGADAPPPATGDAIVLLRSDRPASIEIDGQVIGETPLRIGGLRLGSHRLIVRFVDGVTMSRTIDVGPGEREFTLLGPVRRPPPPAAPAGSAP